MSHDTLRARIEANGARVTALRQRLGPSPTSATLGGLLRDAEAAQAAAEASLAGPDAEIGAAHAAETEDHLAFLERALAGTR